MKAMILAAGRGERMRPLTDTTPKPLLRAGTDTLIGHQILRLRQAGYHELVINTCYLHERLHEALGNGARFGVKIDWSDEYPQKLETAGGIRKAIPLLGSDTFLVVNGDVWCDHPLHPRQDLPDDVLAWLVLVDNPDHNPLGDFALDGIYVQEGGQEKLTFSGIGWYHPSLFSECAPGPLKLGAVLREAISSGRVYGEHFKGCWIDIGTPARLAALDSQLLSQNTN